MAITHYAQLNNENNVINIEIVDVSNTLDTDGNPSETVGIEYLQLM